MKTNHARGFARRQHGARYMPSVLTKAEGVRDRRRLDRRAMDALRTGHVDPDGVLFAPGTCGNILNWD